MVSPNDLKPIENGNQIYQESLGSEIDQSAIYENVLFTCVKKEYPGVVLTPICDIISQKAKYVKLAQIVPTEDVYNKFLVSRGLSDDEIVGAVAIKNKKMRAIKKDFTEQYLQNRTYRYHFLPKLSTVIDYSFIDFQMVQTIYPQDLEKYKKIAALKSPWRESIPSRYAAYCLRIGTPEYSGSFLDSTFENFSDLKLDIFGVV